MLKLLVFFSESAAFCLQIYSGTPQTAKCLSCCSSTIFLHCEMLSSAVICFLLSAILLQLPAELLGPKPCTIVVCPCMWLQKLSTSALCSLEMEVSATARETMWGWGRWPGPSCFLSSDPGELGASRTPTYSLILKQQ